MRKEQDSSQVPVITVDGPSGSGKGTVSRIVARRLAWNFLDSGALYRLVALAALQHSVALDAEDTLRTLATYLDVAFVPLPDGETRVMLEGEDVTQAIRSEQCSQAASRVAALPTVRQALLDCQRALREPPGLVADGRDMGTVVFPDAPLKIFLTASQAERARRRHKQLKEQGTDVSLSDLIEEIAQRDERDAARSAAPLKPAMDAVEVDTTEVAVEVVVERVLGLWQETHRRRQ